MPYFDIRPKTSRRDLFDRDEELRTLLKGINGCHPLILLLGLRRTGKTSLLNVSLNEANVPSIIVDCRVFEEKTSITHSEFLEYFTRETSRLLVKHKTLSRILEQVGGIEVSGLKIELKKSRRGEVLFSKILEALNQWAEENNTCIIIGLDEAQELVKLRGIRLLPIIAHAYDYLRNVSFIVTGSQIGFVHRFLKLENPESPLYGRIPVQVTLKPFTRNQSITYLMEGFREYNMRPPQSILEEVVDNLGGIPGWLTMYGYYAVENKEYNKDLIKRVLETASKTVIREYENFLQTRLIAAKRYTLILKAVAQGYSEWSKIKRYLEVEEGRKISDSIFSQLLRNLVDAGFLEKTSQGYQIPDPILAYAILSYKPKTP